MAARYVPTTLSDFQALLTPEKGWVLNSQGHEHVFLFRLKHTRPLLLIKVYSGVSTNSQQGRGCGKDAIRVCAVKTNTPDTEEGIGYVKAERVYRTKNWRDNLKERVLCTIDEAKNREAWERPTEHKVQG